MRINYNAPAMRAHNALNIADNRVATSLQKLSSGYKVNSAKDNPSGYAIGRRMNTQITGVGVGRQNANTGISIIETADGALTEVHEMLQRMNELAVKGETGTLTTSDRMMLDQELQQLKEEVSRIARDTEFNGQTLLDGSFDLKGYVKNDMAIKVGYYSDEVLDKEYTINSLTVFYDEKGKIDLDKTKANFLPGNNFPKGVELSSVGENCVTITDTKGFEMTLDIDRYAVKSTDPEVVVLSDGEDLPSGDYSLSLQLAYDADGMIDAANSTANLTGPGVPAGITPAFDGNIIKITGADGFEMNIRVPETGTANTTVNKTATLSYKEDEVSYTNVVIDVTGIGSMDTQIGANEGQVLDIRIPTISLQRLGITGAEVTTEEKSADANVAIKGAIAYVSDVRSRLGAYQNRLEHTISSLDITKENMTASYSRIMDVDMAEEMTNYTTEQVISQASTSMLAQANERPSQVLQLLQ